MGITRSACVPSATISKQTVLACFPIGSTTRTWLSNLEDSQWTITNFVPQTRLVCADVTSKNGKIVTHLALTLPVVVNS